MSALLTVAGLTKRFSGLTAVDGVGFSIEAGSITALVGPNGAGKTTCFAMIAGGLRPSAGTVTFEGRPLAGLPPEAVCRRGIARTFQIVRPMRDMSVLENVMVGAFSWTASVPEARACAAAVIERVGMGGRAGVAAEHLTLPERKLLELCRALATRPKLILLDEVMAGLRPAEADRIVAVLRTLRADGLTILLVEHVMAIVMALADRVVVLHHGRVIADGAPATIVHDPAVIESYLGRRKAADAPA